VLLDRGALLEFAVDTRRSTQDVAPTTSRIVEPYARVLYESIGMSHVERVLRSNKEFGTKLVAVRDVELTLVREAEKELLDQTLAGWRRHAKVLHSLQRYRQEVGSMEPDDDVLGYVIRLLLLARHFDADILPSPARFGIVVSVFEASGVKLRSLDLANGCVLYQSDLCDFPYCPAMSRVSSQRFGLLAAQSSESRASGEAVMEHQSATKKTLVESPVSPPLDPTVPLSLLQQAVKAVPAVKYALGIAGLLSVIAIVTGGLKIDLKVAAFGTVVMLVLMTVLVVFAKLASAAQKHFALPLMVFTWFSLVLTMLTAIALFLSVFAGWPLNLRRLF
jgi:hypothetical protein